MAENHRIYPINLYNTDTNAMYSSSTPLYFILSNDFAMQIFDEVYFVCVEKTQLQSKQDYFDTNKFQYLYKICGFTNNSSVETNIVQNFLTQFLQKLNDSPNKKVTNSQIQMLFSTQLYQMAVENERKVNMYNELLNILQEKKKQLENEQQSLKIIAEKKSRRSINLLFTFYGLQAFMLQYGTYTLFSWDIIEPIACLCGTFDLILAYYFWLRHNRSFDFENVKERKLQKMESKIFSKKQFPHSTFEEVELLINHINMRKGYLSLEQSEFDKAVKADLKL